MRARWRVPRALCFTTALSGCACAQIIGADFDSAKLAEPKHDAAAEEASLCDPLLPPERPTDLPMATDEIEFTVVVRTVDFGDSAPDGGTPAYLETGYDLDGLCTGPHGPSSCAPQPWIGGIHPDGPRGQDDAVALLLLNQKPTFGVQAIGSARANSSVALGHDAPLGVIRVRGFGGLGEDDHVEVDWFAVTALGVAGGPDGGVSPKFDAGDRWPILSTSVVDPTVANPADAVSVYRDAQAFVTKNVLVARFPRIAIPLSNVYFELQVVALTAEITRDQIARTWRLDNVVVAGGTSTNGLLGVIPQIAAIVFGVPLCTDNHANYPAVKRFLCESADLPSTPGLPTTSRCASTSVGAKMQTAPASLGPIVAPPVLPSPCPPATDPHNDSCDIPPGTG